jgi:signal transduction histidine kinase
MDTVAAFFARNIVVIYFFYGLAFFCMGLVVWLESRRTSEFRIARAMGPLAGFGIIHGLHEWFEMFQRLGSANATNIPAWLLSDQIRIGHLVLSFLLLVIFGVRLIYSSRKEDGNEHLFAYLSAGALLAVWLVSAVVTRRLYPRQADFLTAVDVLARYILAIPGALLAAWAIVLEQRTFRARGMPGFGRDLLRAALALLLYGLVGQAFPKQSYLFPANVVNADLFIQLFGIPVQLFRAFVATLMAIFVIRALRAFDLERQQRLTAAHEARLAAQREALVVQQRAREETEQLNQELQAAYGQLQAREALRRDLLHQIVSAQENERQRIARELHDGTGQVLTALGLGITAAGENVRADPALAARQLTELKAFSARALQELREVISNLRPSILDDLGLVPAIQGQAQEFEARTGLRVEFVVNGRRQRVQPEIETVIFRIAQEALTNVARHARAQNVTIHLTFDSDALRLTVEDDGRGFEPEAALKASARRQAWGLLGIQERVALVGGSCVIESQPGSGTTVRVDVPLTREGVNHVPH